MKRLAEHDGIPYLGNPNGFATMSGEKSLLPQFELCFGIRDIHSGQIEGRLKTTLEKAKDEKWRVVRNEQRQLMTVSGFHETKKARQIAKLLGSRRSLDLEITKINRGEAITFSDGRQVVHGTRRSPCRMRDESSI